MKVKKQLFTYGIKRYIPCFLFLTAVEVRRRKKKYVGTENFNTSN